MGLLCPTVAGFTLVAGITMADEKAQISPSELAVWIATGVLCAGAYARHGLLVRRAATSLAKPPFGQAQSPPRRQVSGLYWLSTAILCMLDPSLHSLQLLNLAAVVYDLSFELQRLYMLVSNRPLLMVVILAVALAVEWLLERYEEDDNSVSTRRGARRRRTSCAKAAAAQTRPLVKTQVRWVGSLGSADPWDACCCPASWACSSRALVGCC